MPHSAVSSTAYRQIPRIFAGLNHFIALLFLLPMTQTPQQQTNLAEVRCLLCKDPNYSKNGHRKLALLLQYQVKPNGCLSVIAMVPTGIAPPEGAHPRLCIVLSIHYLLPTPILHLIILYNSQNRMYSQGNPNHQPCL